MLKPLIPFAVLVVVLAVYALLPDTPVRVYYLAGVIAGIITVVVYMFTRRLGNMMGLGITLTLIVAGILIGYGWIPPDLAGRAILACGGVGGLVAGLVFVYSGK